MDRYCEKESSYFENIRTDMLALVPPNPDNVLLEIGAGTGNTLIKAKELGLAKEVVGVDVVTVSDSNQTNPLIDRFIIGNLDTINLDYPENYFDVVMGGDVLEHLIDPWAVVKNLKKHIKPGGLFITAIPNIKELKTLYTIIFKGDFRYAKSGILDRTHLRFFCKKNMIELFSDNGFVVEKIFSNIDTFDIKSERRLFNELTFHLFDQFMAKRYFIVARKPYF